MSDDDTATLSDDEGSQRSVRTRMSDDDTATLSDDEGSQPPDGDALWEVASNFSGVVGSVSDEDEELFLDSNDSMTSDSNDIQLVSLEDMSDEDYDDSDSSSVQVLSEAEQLDVSSVVEVWTDRGDEHADDNDDDRTASPGPPPEQENDEDDAETEEDSRPPPDSGPCAAAEPSDEQKQVQTAQPSTHERSVADEEGTTCTICFETWTASGVHRLASLKCGHLYGLSCIEKWVRGQAAKCPQCNASARKSDIRPIYAQKLAALDTTELDRVVGELSKEREKRKRSEIDAELMRQKYNLLLLDYEKVKSEYSHYRESNKRMRLDPSSSSLGCGEGSSLCVPTTSSQRSAGSFLLDRVINLGANTTCRSLAVSGVLDLLVVSQNRTGLFSGFGLRKVSLLDLKSSEFVMAHKAEIKDIAFHRQDALVLSASHDKTVKLTAMVSNSAVQSYNQPMEAWSCAWDQDDSNCFYVGLRNGAVFKYDMRVTSESVCKLPSTDRFEPVVAMRHIPRGACSAEDRSPSGLLVSQFQMCSFFEKQAENEFRVHPLHLEGNCVSISYEQNTRHLLMSCRPTLRNPHITHSVCNLVFPMDEAEGRCAFNVVQVFNGGPTQVQLSRSCICLDPENSSNCWAVAGDESFKQVLVWDAALGKRVHRLGVTNTILDVCPVTTPAGWGLAALAKNTLSFYSYKHGVSS
ncbi:E3 ubiquitin-protein ligase RFWD3-like [Haemaphysalis longicornis]